MSRNICSDGTLATESNTCLVTLAPKGSTLISGSIYTTEIEKGPITAMDTLYNATKNWSNIDNVNVNYIDGNKYGGITTDGNITKITKKDGTITTTYENLKARLPEIAELEPLGCDEGNNSTMCPSYLMDGLTSDSNYPEGTKEDINGIIGYWTPSSKPVPVLKYGYLESKGNSTSVTYGVRPVIELKKTDLS